MSDAKAAKVETDRTIQRLRVAEHALELLKGGELPQVRKYVFGATYDVREITDLDVFHRLATADDSLKPLLKHSKSEGFVKVSFSEEEGFHFTGFRERDCTEVDALLLAHAQRSAAALTFAALGLDMSAVLELDPPQK